MKKNLLALLSMLALLVAGCSTEDPAIRNEKSKIVFQLEDQPTRAIPAGSSLIFSLKSASGKEIFTDQYVDLIQEDQVLISEPIEVIPGEYEITDFMIVYDDEVIFATPRAGSETSSEISKPLSYKFNASALNKIISMEVLPAAGKDPKKFGYESFRKPVRDNYWRIGIYVEENGELILTTGYATLIRPDGSGLTQEVEAAITTFEFEPWEDRSAEYTLIASKAGYVQDSAKFIFDKIPAHGKKPFKFVLEKQVIPVEFTLGGTFGSIWLDFKLGFRGEGSITLNYNDGLSETINFSPGATSDTSSVIVHHDFVGLDNNTMLLANITGDIDQVMAVKTISVYMPWVNVTALPNLENLDLYGAGLFSLDLSQNTKLTHLTFLGTSFNELKIGNSPELKNVSVTFMSEGINLLVHEVHANTVAHNITGGNFFLDLSESEALTPENLALLEDLENNYGWTYEIVD
jgi:hypothetical protein